MHGSIVVNFWGNYLSGGVFPSYNTDSIVHAIYLIITPTCTNLKLIDLLQISIIFQLLVGVHSHHYSSEPL